MGLPQSLRDSLMFTIPIATDGSFSWEGEWKAGTMLVVTLYDDYISMPWYVEAQEYTIEKRGERYYVVSKDKESMQNHFVAFREEQDKREHAYDVKTWGYEKITDMEEKIRLSIELEKEYAANQAYLLSGIRQFAATEIGSYLADEKLYALPLHYNFFSQVMEALEGKTPPSRMINRLEEAYTKVKAKQLTREAPDFELPDAQGRVMRFSSLRGKYVMLDFWASWCVSCRKKNRELNKHYPELHAAGLEVVSVSLDEDRDKWLKAVKEDQMAWTQLVDFSGLKQSRLKEAYKIKGLPAVYLIDPEGNIVKESPTLDDLKNVLEMK